MLGWYDWGIRQCGTGMPWQTRILYLVQSCREVTPPGSKFVRFEYSVRNDKIGLPYLPYQWRDAYIISGGR
jgi:hypothetical protein